MTLKRDDPTVRMLRSGFGRQTRSENTTHPQWCFGTSSREHASKQYISPEHARAMNGNNSQGAVYKVYSGMGPQPESNLPNAASIGFGSAARLAKGGRSNSPGPGAYKSEGALGDMKDSRRATSPRAVFGSSTRDAVSKIYLDEELNKTFYGRETPAPNVYAANGAVGKQADSKKENAPAWRQGTGQRFKYDFMDRARDLPGAGQYNQYAAVGKQTLSIKKSLPVYSFGTSTRDSCRKAFISKEHEKGNYGLLTPGPSTANPKSSLGRQNVSQKATAAGWGFGTARRIKDYGNGNPGPGTYYA